MTRLGLISDTHGLLRPEVFDALAGVDRLLHAGDVGSVGILDDLAAIAPVTAVWGNTDGDDVRGEVPEVAALDLEGRSIVLVHGHQLGSPAPGPLREAYPRADVIVYGHTHRPLEDWHAGRLVVNPGAAGAARFRLRPSVAILTLGDDASELRFLEL